MKHKIILEVDHNLKEGEILQYKNGVVRSVAVRELLPELADLKSQLATLVEITYRTSADVGHLQQQVAELRGEEQ